MATKKQTAEHERALQRVTEAAAQGGPASVVSQNLGFSRIRVTHGTTIILGGEGSQVHEDHPEASKFIGKVLEGDDEAVVDTALAMQWEALGQVEILGRVADGEEES